MNQFSGILIAFFSAAVFGLYPPSARLAYAEGANATFMILTTTFCRALSLVVYCIIKGQPLLPETGKWRIVISGGFFQSLSILGIIGSLVYLPGPITIIVMFSHTIMLLFFLAYRK